MTKPRKILENLTLNHPRPSISSIEKGMEELKGKEKFLEAIHIFIESFSPKLYPPKKKYFNISKFDKPSKLDKWIYKNLVDNHQYSQYLDEYLPLRKKLDYEDVDDYILEKHYRSKAIRILSKSRRSFDLQKWTKKRFGYDFQRKTNLPLKEGRQFPLDFRNILESLYILKKGEDKLILTRGGGGSSGQRMKYTLFTTVFSLLGKNKRIKHYLLKYNSINEYEYITTYYRPIISINYGSNYPSLDKKLRKKIIKNGISFAKIKKEKGLKLWNH